MNRVKTGLAVIFVLVLLYLCHQVVTLAHVHQQNRMDNAEVNHIQYGIFSVNQWKDRLYEIIIDEVNRFNLTKDNQAALRAHIEEQLDGLINKVEQRIKESNAGTAKGWLRQFFIDALVKKKEIKKGIPKYAKTVVDELTKAKNEEQLKAEVKRRIDEYFSRTFEKQDSAKLDAVLIKLGVKEIENAKKILGELTVRMQKSLNIQSWIMIGFSALLFLMIGWHSGTQPPPIQFIMLLLALFILLIAGISTPMIDMEAKISKMSFYLMEHPVSFENQVLYFQSKSICDVFLIMMNHKELEMKAVGILMVLFSIVFPLFKILSSLLYYYDFHGAKSSRWIQFFVLKSGKWSMTDVQVVAIFMAYIGFNGIISSQFGNLVASNKQVSILTTNGTSLQPGFYLFLTYAILALVLSGFLTKKPAEPKAA